MDNLKIIYTLIKNGIYFIPLEYHKKSRMTIIVNYYLYLDKLKLSILRVDTTFTLLDEEDKKEHPDAPELITTQTIDEVHQESYRWFKVLKLFKTLKPNIRHEK